MLSPDREPKGRQVAGSHPATLSPPWVTHCPLLPPSTTPNSFQDVESLQIWLPNVLLRLGGCFSRWLSFTTRTQQLVPGSTPSPGAPAHGRGAVCGNSSITPTATLTPVKKFFGAHWGGCERHQVPPGRRDGQGWMQEGGSGGPCPPAPNREETGRFSRAAQPPPTPSRRFR